MYENFIRIFYCGSESVTYISLYLPFVHKLAAICLTLVKLHLANTFHNIPYLTYTCHTVLL